MMGERVNILQLFLETIRKEMAFLVNEYKFQGPYADFGLEDRQKYLCTVWYTAKALAVEFVLDWRDQAVDCYIVRLEEGRFPEEWAVNERGQRVRERLGSWIRQRGIQPKPPSTECEKRKGRWRHVTWEEALEEEIIVSIPHYAFLLRSYGRPILEDQRDVVWGKN